MPSGLPEEARREWRRIAPLLDELGVLASLDRAALVRYCTTWAEWVDVNGTIERTGHLVRGRDGNAVRNPLLLVRRDLASALDSLAAQLALSPAARLRNNIHHERGDEEEEVPPGVADIEAYRKRMQA